MSRFVLMFLFLLSCKPASHGAHSESVETNSSAQKPALKKEKAIVPQDSQNQNNLDIPIQKHEEARQYSEQTIDQIQQSKTSNSGKKCVPYLEQPQSAISSIAQKIEDLANGLTGEENEEEITKILLSLKGEELFGIKNKLQNNKYDLIKIIFYDIDDLARRSTILTHLNQFAWTTNEVRIISDIDDTVIPWQNDARFADDSHSTIPGIRALYSYLDCSLESDRWLGDLTFLSARPTFLANNTLEKLSGLGFKNFGVIEGKITNILSTEMIYTWEVDPEKIATDKLENFQRFLQVYPEYQKIILFGDSGQGDVSFFEQAVQLFPEKIAFAIVHDVKPENTSQSRRQYLSSKKIFFVRNYAHAAKIAFEQKYLSLEEFEEVKKVTLAETTTYSGLKEEARKVILSEINAVK